MTGLDMPIREDDESLEDYSIRLVAYAQILENKIKATRKLLPLLRSAQEYMNVLIVRIKENLR